jgi:hypothetical protein
MSNKTYTGRPVTVMIDDRQETELSSGTTTAGQIYVVLEKGAGSTIPVDEGMMFYGPTSAVTLITGDSLLPLNPEKVCKTTVSLSVTEGTVDVSDDCQTGNLLNGITTFSGSFDGLFYFDRKTNEYTNVMKVVLNKFFDMVHDDKNNITILPKNNGNVYMLVTLVAANKAGEYDQYLFAPVNLTGTTLKTGDAEGLGQSVPFNQAPGVTHLYERLR